MKKIQIFLFAAISILAVASCTRDELVETSVAGPNGESTVLTLSFDKTKTSLVNGKTTWLAGDKIRIYSSTGKFYEDVVVPSEDDNKTSVEVTVNMKDDFFYAVYPVEAANGISSGKVGFKIPTNPDGRFASANISAAKSSGDKLAMRNITGVLKINITSGNVVEILQFSAQNPLTGTGTVNLDGEDPVVEVVSSAKSATVAVGAVDGDYYIPVLPGVYDEEFSVTALKGNGGYQTLTTTRKNEVAVNDILNMGSIGDNLTDGLAGEGTESDPYVIRNLGEYGAFASSVNLGNTYAGKFVKLEADIDGAGIPIGYCKGELDFYFEGTFKGENHTVTLDLDGDKCKDPSYVAMFGQISPTAVIENVKVAGQVSTTGSYVAGLVGYVGGTATTMPTITGCESSAAVEGADYVGGIIGFGQYVSVVNCTNSGKVTGKRSVAGIAGHLYGSKCETSKNIGEVKGTVECGGIYQNKVDTWNSGYWYNWETKAQTNINSSIYGVGGVAGFAQNSEFHGVKNDGPVSGVTKVGGIIGGAYNCSSEGAVNNGKVTASSKFAGGLVGWIYTSFTSTSESNYGPVTAPAVVGGIIGFFNALGFSSGDAVSNVKNAKNAGTVQSTGKFSMAAAQDTQADYSMAGGIIGLMGHNSTVSNSPQRGIIHLISCTNSGDITGVGNGVGGLVGLAWSWFQKSTMSTIENSSNTGKVTGYCRLGGILGEQFDRWIGHGTLTLRNLVNSGEVVATIPTGTSSVAGIVGRSHYHSTSTVISAGQYGTKIENCLNLGRITYAADDNASPYAGGIGGYFGRGYIKNSANMGYVGPASGNKPVDDALRTIGGIAGQLGTTYTPVSYSYWFADVAKNAFGTISKDNTITSAVSFNGSYALSEEVKIGENTYDAVVDALNAWATANTSVTIVYSGWKIGSNGLALSE